MREDTLRVEEVLPFRVCKRGVECAFYVVVALFMEDIKYHLFMHTLKRIIYISLHASDKNTA